MGIETILADLKVESPPDEQLLALCDSMLDRESQAALSEWLERQREGTITDAELPQFRQLLAAYRRGLVQKARALKEAVARGLNPRLNDNAA